MSDRSYISGPANIAARKLGTDDLRNVVCDEDGRLFLATSPGASGTLSVQGMALSGSVLTSASTYPVLAGMLGSDNRVWPLRGQSGSLNINGEVEGKVADGDAVTGVSPVLMGASSNVGALNRALRTHPFSDDGNSNTTNLLQVQAGLRVLNAVGSLDRVRGATGASGTTGTGLLGAGVMVQGTNGVFRPLRGEVDGLNVAPQRPTLVNRSGTITASGTAQQIMAANPNRKYLLIQNTGANDLWFGFGNAQPNQPSFKLTANSSFVMESNVVATDAIYVYSATTGADWSAREG